MQQHCHTCYTPAYCCYTALAFLQLSTKRVITMEWIEGCRVNDQAAMQHTSLRPKDVAVLLLDVFAEMTYVHGFVHADPHPGNILVRPAPDQGPPPPAAVAVCLAVLATVLAVSQ